MPIGSAEAGGKKTKKKTQENPQMLTRAVYSYH